MKTGQEFNELLSATSGGQKPRARPVLCVDVPLAIVGAEVWQNQCRLDVLILK